MHTIPCLDDSPRPLVTAAMVSELPVDGWAVSTAVLNIRIQLPSMPSDLSAFLRRLTMFTISLPVVNDGNIFPVDIIRPQLLLPNRTTHDSQPRLLRKRAPRPPSSVTDSRLLNPLAN